MKDLIERLEKATGPDHALDCAIYREWRKSAPPPRGGGIWTTDLEYAPAYTASLDAALTLVPEGWWLTGCGEQRTQIIYVKDRHEPTGFFYAKVQHIKGGRLQVASARSIAIALCIAALKARVHLRDASEQEAVSPEGADGPQHMEAGRG